MSLNTGARLGPYEIVGRIGAGGMGEVYKAWDTRLDRAVAIKILPTEFASDPDRRERFEREARAVAALNHPHICNLHDIGDAPDPEAAAPGAEPVRFLVMEYLEGQTLADRLVRGALPAAEVWRYAIELADALDHAHRRGLVHRDLKPGNVMLTARGAKLLDFGLSRLQTNPDVPALATVTHGEAPLTAAGAVLGTFPYMSPEQLSGREVDARSDLFAFGAVVYEMATGRRAFDGATSATVIGAVLHSNPPPVSSLQPLLPALDRLVLRCLAKAPDDRWQTARDLVLELKWAADHGVSREAAAPPQRGRTLRVAFIAALIIMAAAAATMTTAYVQRGRSHEEMMRLSFVPPAGMTMADLAFGGPVTISPDGQHLAFVGAGPDHKRLLWVRALSSLTAAPLPGTDGAAYPFWSPDSRQLGFFAQRKLKKIAASGGPVQTLCDALQPRGGTWSQDGVIVFSANTALQLYSVSAGGGPPARLPADGKNEERYWPSFLPDGRHFIYRGRPQQHGIFVASVDSPGATLLLPDYLGAAYVPGYIVGLIGSSPAAWSGTLMAIRFDAATLSISGDPVAVAEAVAYRVNVARAAFSVSASGTLVYGGVESGAAQLTWFDRGGRQVGTLGGDATYNLPVLSPDERTIAAERFDAETQAEDIWLIDTTRDVPSRFTDYPNADETAVWSPDGRGIVFSSPRNSPPNLYLKTLNGTGPGELLFKSRFNSEPADWSRDGKFILYASLDPNTQWDLWLFPMSGDEASRKPVPLLRTQANEPLGQFSPDGRWLAYVSDESGANEVYVQTFPTLGSRQRMSANGGNGPKWRADGKELFYLAPDGTLMAVQVKTAANFEATAPRPLFVTRMSGVGAADNWGYATNYAVSRDGQRFLVNTVRDGTSTGATTIALNWLSAVRPR